MYGHHNIVSLLLGLSLFLLSCGLAILKHIAILVLVEAFLRSYNYLSSRFLDLGVTLLSFGVFWILFSLFHDLLHRTEVNVVNDYLLLLLLLSVYVVDLSFFEQETISVHLILL